MHQTSSLTRDLLLISAFAPSLLTTEPRRFRSLSISGDDICGLMRRHHITIRELAEVTALTQSRIREWRRNGLQGFSAAEAVYHITGSWIA